jgi:GNAT superfamily N-acetyltransferase
MTTPLSDPAEFDRHMRGRQHVYSVSGHRNSPEELCGQHARQAADQLHHQTMLGLSTGLVAPDSPEHEASIGKPHHGTCVACARQLEANQRPLKPLDLPDRVPTSRSPFGPEQRGLFRPPKHTLEPFRPQLPSSLNRMQVTAEEDYWGGHRPGSPSDDEGTAAPAHELTQGGVYPHDVYDKPHLFGGGEGLYGGPKAFKETVRTLRSIRGKPDAPVTMYRSLPPEHAHKGFRTGDWTSVHGDYARGHGLHNTDEHKDWPVIKATVPAKHLFNDGNSLDEFGYHGPPVRGEIHFPGGRDARIEHGPDGMIKRAVAEPPADLHFEHTEQPSGGSKWPTEHVLTAHTQGGKAGHLQYFTGPRERKVLIDRLEVEHDRQRQGIGSALMDEVQRRHPNASINHGDRTDAGKAWWKGYTQDKSVQRGRVQ